MTLAKQRAVIAFRFRGTKQDFFHSKVINDLEVFKHTSDLILANRIADELCDVKDKV